VDDSKNFLERLLSEASGGKAKIITGSQLADILDGKPGALRDILGDSMPNCGEKDCPIHGSNPDIIDDDKLTAMTPDDMEANALSATAAAHNALVRKQYEKAKLFQTQSMLWTGAAERERLLLGRQEQREREASSAEAEEPVR
jgi:hypothetical protein